MYEDQIIQETQSDFWNQKEEPQSKQCWLCEILSYTRSLTSLKPWWPEILYRIKKKSPDVLWNFSLANKAWQDCCIYSWLLSLDSSNERLRGGVNCFLVDCNLVPCKSTLFQKCDCGIMMYWCNEMKTSSPSSTFLNLPEKTTWQAMMACYQKQSLPLVFPFKDW